nr:EAL domain-containing protein [Acholeplasmatales bacterium]
DKSLITNIDNSKNRIILEKLISLFKALNIDMICEGVENDMQKVLLNKMGCNKIQGYLYSKPISVEEFNEKYNIKN